MIIPLCGTASCWLTGVFEQVGNMEYNHLPNGARVILMKRKRPHIHYLDSYQRRGDCGQNGLSGQLPERRFMQASAAEREVIRAVTFSPFTTTLSSVSSPFSICIALGSFLHVDVPQGDVVQFGFRQSVSYERYAVYAVTGYIFNADVAE